MVRFVTIPKFGELTGYSPEATRAKIARGDWMLDREYKKAPDGRILMDLQGYERWAEGNAPTAFVRRPTARSRSTSAIEASAAANG